ncbi:HAD family hydrolase [Microbacterium xanthum]|uniref:HAD family hydrolase n=1 Tax=Microbacterium xanthum TaxID=3079794 RepID=UPI002AD5AC91|nr:HAD family hydrolase [Microbacterium sp. KSW-48]MDZ8173059.1 HAD family hydrolase [Microbacterium sp. KSW-48]
MTGTIVFDLDGTLALGDGPIVAYAHSLAGFAGDGLLARAEAELASFAAGGSDYRDGYHAVGTVAEDAGVAADDIRTAYETSRRVLGTPAAPVAPPEGIADLLRDLSSRVRLVLATNAPDAGVRELLAEWGIAELFSATHFTVGKPDGLIAVVRHAQQDGPVLSVGDIAEFDLAPAAELGADTALVGATCDSSPFPATMRGRTVTDLSDDLRAWAAAACASSPAHPTV